MSASARLAELGLTLPKPAAPVGSYVPATRLGDVVLTSGQIPLVDGKVAYTGQVGAAVDLAAAQKAAEICCLNALSACAAVVGGIDRIARVVRVVVFVASADTFTDQPKVANGASDLLVKIFGDAGRHARSAVGVPVLPLGATVELELTVEARD